MDETPKSLLERLQDGNEAFAWERFVRLYTPLIWHWSRRMGMADQDLPDFVQEVFTVLVKELPTFQYDPARRFRGWLWTVTLNKWREKQRRQSLPHSDQSPSKLEDLRHLDHISLDEQEYRRYLVHRAQQIMQADFEPATWQAFWQCVVEDRPASDVAAELSISLDAVYKYKSRVLRRLRQELKGLLD